MLVRLGDRRYLRTNAAFDVIFGVALGSLLGWAIAPSLAVAGAVIGGVILAGLHWLFAVIAFQLDWFRRLIKGDAHTPIKGGTRLERSGDVSAIPAHRGLRVVDVRVEAGVQAIRVEIA